MSAPSSRYVRGKLEAARALVASGWCQHAPAARGPGSPLTSATDPTARAWSPVGAIMRATADRGAWEGGATPLACLRALRDALPKATAQGSGQAALCAALADWNDAEGRTKADVLALFDSAIDRLQREEAA